MILTYLCTYSHKHTHTPTESPAHIHMLYELTEKWSKRKFQGYEDMNVHWAKLKNKQRKRVIQIGRTIQNENYFLDIPPKLNNSIPINRNKTKFSILLSRYFLSYKFSKITVIICIDFTTKKIKIEFSISAFINS